MSEDREQMSKSYKRAAIGLGVAAIFWTASYWLVERKEGDQGSLQNWLIPLGAAALSAFCYSLYRNSKNE
jgi:hypothetical protein